MVRLLPLLASLTAVPAALGPPDVDLEAVKRTFAAYVDLAHRYDTRYADLFADDAVIRSTRLDPNGPGDVLEITGREYKKLLRRWMPELRKRKARSVYSHVTYTREGSAFRVQGTRHAVHEDFHGPFSLLLERQPNGSWLVTEELGVDPP